MSETDELRKDVDDHSKEIERLWDAHGRLKEEQIRLREHMTARFDSQDRRITDVRDELRAEIQTGDANNEKRHNELKDSIKDTLSGLAASNPVWVTFAIVLVVGVLSSGITWLIATK